MAENSILHIVNQKQDREGNCILCDGQHGNNSYCQADFNDNDLVAMDGGL